MPGTTTVRITLSGVRIEQIPRLKTVVQSYLQRFGAEITVDDGIKKEPPKKGK